MGFFSKIFGGDDGAEDAFKAQKSYSKKARTALEEALGKQEALFRKGQERYSGFAGMGLEALPQLMAMTGTRPSAAMSKMFEEQGISMPTEGYDLTQDPGYQFRFGEGQRALERRAAAGGKRFAGQTLMDLSRYGQDYASQEYNKAYGRLAGLQQQLYGMGTAGRERMTSLEDVMAQRYGQHGTSMANLYTGLGSAAASAKLAQAQQQQSGLGSLLGLGTTVGLAGLGPAGGWSMGNIAGNLFGR